MKHKAHQFELPVDGGFRLIVETATAPASVATQTAPPEQFALGHPWTVTAPDGRRLAVQVEAATRAEALVIAHRICPGATVNR